MQVFFTDGITNISMSAPGLVRIEFGALAPASREEGHQQMSLSPTQQVVMPIEGFLRAFGTQEQVMKKLIADGMVKRREEGEAEVAAKP